MRDDREEMRTDNNALPPPFDRADRLHPGVERAQRRSQLLQLWARQADERRAEPPERFDETGQNDPTIAMSANAAP
jgi:hypothetical protein